MSFEDDKNKEEEMKKTKSNITLTTISFLDKKERITSPHSIEAINLLGYDIKQLYYISFEEYIKKHPELKNVSDELKEKRYNMYEEKRKKKINEAKMKREEIIENEKNKKLNKSKSTSQYFLEQESYILKNEREKLNVIKNQKISELRNLIEFEFKVKEMKKKTKIKLNYKKKKKKKNLN